MISQPVLELGLDLKLRITARTARDLARKQIQERIGALIKAQTDAPTVALLRDIAVRIFAKKSDEVDWLLALVRHALAEDVLPFTAEPGGGAFGAFRSFLPPGTPLLVEIFPRRYYGGEQPNPWRVKLAELAGKPYPADARVTAGRALLEVRTKLENEFNEREAKFRKGNEWKSPEHMQLSVERLNAEIAANTPYVDAVKLHCEALSEMHRGLVATVQHAIAHGNPTPRALAGAVLALHWLIHDSSPVVPVPEQAIALLASGVELTWVDAPPVADLEHVELWVRTAGGIKVRGRCGFTFTHTPLKVRVNRADEKLLRADDGLEVSEHGAEKERSELRRRVTELEAQLAAELRHRMAELEAAAGTVQPANDDEPAQPDLPDDDRPQRVRRTRELAQ